MREAAAEHLPGLAAHRVHDVWLAGPPLAGRVAAADYRVERRDGRRPPRARGGRGGLLAAARAPERTGEGRLDVRYDLRPLLVDFGVVDVPLVVRARTRFHPVLGTGRPGRGRRRARRSARLALVVASIVRERLILVDELDEVRG